MKIWMIYDRGKSRYELSGQKALAQASYNLSHPMWRLLGRALERAKEMAEVVPDRHQASAYLAIRHIEQASQITKMLTIVGRAGSFPIGAGEQVFLIPGKTEWRSTTPYNLTSKLQELAPDAVDLMQAGYHVKHIQPQFHQSALSLEIYPWIAAEEIVRPLDDLYDLVLSELLLNLRWGSKDSEGIVTVNIGAIDANGDFPNVDGPVLVLKNTASLEAIECLKEFVNRGWQNPDALQGKAVGWLTTFASTLLAATGAGYLRIQVLSHDDEYTYEVALILKGVKRVQKG